MNLRTATPQEVDEAIAALEEQAWKQRAIIHHAHETAHDAAGDRQRNQRWQMTDAEALDRVRAYLADDTKHVQFLSVGGQDKIRKMLAGMDAATAEYARLAAEIERHEDEFRDRPWSRFHQLRSTSDARIHGSRWCSGLYRSDLGDLGWHPELSGKSEAEAVKELGPVMCSKCFRSAPAEWKQNPKDLRVNPNACPGSEKSPVEGTMKWERSWTGGEYWGKCSGCSEIRRVRSSDSKMSKHDKPKGKENEITAPDGKPLRVGGNVIKSTRTAEIEYVDDASYVMACDEGWYSHHGRLDEARRDANQILEALAAKNDNPIEVERTRLGARVLKKARAYK